jgi:deoxyribonuclease-2
MFSYLKNVLILLSILNLSLIQINSQTLETCIGIKGNPVDWYLILLYPENSSPSGKLSYGYFDNNSQNIEYYLYDNVTFPPLFFTRELNKKKNTNIIFWNDDRSTETTKDSASDSKAHSKGSLIYNAQSGRFLTHSLPRFPRRTDDNVIIPDLPENAGIYAQHFLCISLNGIEAGNIINDLDIISPSIVYQHGLKDLVGYNTETVDRLLSGNTNRKRSTNVSRTISSKNGFEFDLFGKSNLITDLPFEKLIPEIYESNVYVETWNKPQLIPIVCNTKFKVMNIKELKFSEFSYNTFKEHSKWAVLESKPVSCVSDLNRIESQRKRGGFTICIRYEKLAKIFRSGIVGYEKCANQNLLFLENLE